MDILIYVIAGAIVGVIIALFMYWAKKDNERLATFVASLSDEQKNRLEAAEIFAVEGKPNCWIQETLIVEAKDKGAKVAVVALYFNRTIQNFTYEKICHADVTISKADFDAKGLQIGSYTNMYFDPEKSAKIL